MLQDRLRRSGTDGQRVQQFVQSLASRRHHPESGVAVGSGSYNELVDKVNAMHNEMEELRRLVRLSFDLQLDVQRNLRQQLAAITVALVKPTAQFIGEGDSPVCAEIKLHGWSLEPHRHLLDATASTYCQLLQLFVQ